MRMRVLAAFACAGIALAACGGGSTSTPLPAAGTKPSQPQSHAKATFVVKIPPKAASTSSRTPKYLTADIQGIAFSVSQNNGSVYAGGAFYPVNAQQTYCSTPSGGGLVCTLDVVALPGDDTFVVTTYDKPETFDANVISTGSLQQTISAVTANTVNIVTSGVPTFFAMSVDNPFPSVGGTQPLHLLALDADANVIVGPYDTPVTLSNSDTSGATVLSATSAASSTDASALTITYAGLPLSASATITVQSNSPDAMYWNGSANATLHFNEQGWGVLSTPSYLLFSNTSAAPQTITLTGTAGTTAPYTASTALDGWSDWGVLATLHNGWQSTTGCQGIVAVSGTAPTFTVTPVHTGVCWLSITDTSNNFGTVPVVVQSL